VTNLSAWLQKCGYVTLSMTVLLTGVCDCKCATDCECVCCDRMTVTNCQTVGMASANIDFRHRHVWFCAFMQLS